MEHLPVPNKAVQKNEGIIPFVCHDGYDGGPFLSYFERIGILPTLYTEGMLPGNLPYLQAQKVRSMPGIEPMTQTWLFFGLIHEILGKLCEPQDFVRVVKGGHGHYKALTTSSLVGILHQWVALVQSKAIDPLPTYDHLAECLRLMFSILLAVPEKFNPVMKLSLASLGEIITTAVNKAFDIKDFVPENKCPICWGSLLDSAYWKPRFLESGWCISQVTYILKHNYNKNLQMLHSLANLGQFVTSGSHGSCTEVQCLVYQTNLDNYKTRHRNLDCHCGEVRVDTMRVYDILKKGSLPLLRLKGNQKDGEISVDIVPSNEKSQYVALSHVWADGLGNARRNALHNCQLLFLKGLIEELNIPSAKPSRDLLFWCDTLCCPVEPKAAKDLALTRMSRTYQKALCVLVLDSSLLSYSTESADYDELCSRILTCGWVRRLWTLQEGILASENHRLRFQFQDRAIDSRTLLRGIIDIFKSSIGRKGVASFAVYGMGAFALNFQEDLHGSGTVDIKLVDAALQNRSVSVASDEALIIGTLLELDMARLLHGPEHSRMNRLWSLMPSARQRIPKAILFRICPRLIDPGYRWAPATLLHSNPANLLLERNREADQGIPAKDGLLVQLPGYRISTGSLRKGLPSNPWNATPPDEESLSSRSVDGSWYIIARRLPVEQASLLSDRSLRSLLRCDPESAESDILGLILTQVKEEENIKYARSELHVHMALKSPAAQGMLELAFQLVQQLYETPPAQRIVGFDQEEIDIVSPAWEDAFTALESEIYRLINSEGVQKSLEMVANSSPAQSSKLLVGYVVDILAGRHGFLTLETPEDQQWCID